MQQRGTNSVALQNPSGSVQIPLLQPAWGGLCWGQLEGVQLSREGDELWSGSLPWSRRSGNSRCFVTSVSLLSCTILCLLAWQTISRRNSIPAMAVQKIVHGDLLPDSLPLALFFVSFPVHSTVILGGTGGVPVTVNLVFVVLFSLSLTSSPQAYSLDMVLSYACFRKVEITYLHCKYLSGYSNVDTELLFSFCQDPFIPSRFLDHSTDVYAG